MPLLSNAQLMIMCRILVAYPSQCLIVVDMYRINRLVRILVHLEKIRMNRRKQVDQYSVSLFLNKFFENIDGE